MYLRSEAWLGDDWEQRQRVQQALCQAGECTHLGVVLSTGEQRQLIGGGEVGPDLLHLPEPLPLAPLGSPVLKPHLGRGEAGL